MAWFIYIIKQQNDLAPLQWFYFHETKFPEIKPSRKFLNLQYVNSYMGESFQDYSWIQDFEADFP